MDSERKAGLLAWQWSRYPATHRDRRNLLVHALTAPLFLAGVCALVAGLLQARWLLAGVGLLGVVLPVVLQGRTHTLETNAPAPFRGPADVAARLFVEQWVTFPRYVLSGGFARAWRASAPSR
jgi:hypothetical protein